MSTIKNRISEALLRLSDYLEKWALEQPDHTAFIYNGQEISYKEFEVNSRQLARYLMELGIKKGDRLAYLMTGRPEFFYLLMAASMTGTIIVGLSTRHSPREMTYILHNSGAKYLLTLDSLKENDYQKILAQVLANTPDVQQTWVVGQSVQLPGAVSFQEIMQADHSSHDEELNRRISEVGPEDGLLIVYTSGTTGKEKGALMTHRNIISSSLVQLDEFFQPFGTNPNDIFQHQVPVNHVSGAVEWGAAPVIGGCTSVLTDGFNPREVLENTQKYHIPILAGVPTMWTMMFNLPDFDQYDLSSVRFCLTGGAMANKKILEEMKRISPYCVNPYGLTESCGFFTYTKVGADVENLCQTVGRSAPEFELQIFNDKNQPVARGVPGEIVLRGDSIIKQYFNDQEATAKAIDEENWFHTGDIGLLDENDDLHLLGRTTEMFITGGYNVYPAEIEEQIALHPEVMLIAVLPIPHSLVGEVGRAYIVTVPDSSLTDEDLMNFLRDSLADYKIPRQYIFRNSLPMTALGKIEKKVLLQEIKEEFDL